MQCLLPYRDRDPTRGNLLPWNNPGRNFAAVAPPLHDAEGTPEKLSRSLRWEFVAKRGRGRMAPPATKVLCWFCFRRIPDSDLASFRHQKEAEHETYRRNGDRIYQRVA